MLARPPSLGNYLGKRIDQICPFSIGKDHSRNHCAHFVSHVMEYDGFAVNCKNQTFADKQHTERGAAIRVDDIFNIAPEAGQWAQRPQSLTSCLIFVTNSGNLGKIGNRLRMKNGAKKHIGIFVDGMVWHYSNTGDQVVKDSLAIFTAKFKNMYMVTGQTVEFLYGKFLK